MDLTFHTCASTIKYYVYLFKILKIRIYMVLTFHRFSFLFHNIKYYTPVTVECSSVAVITTVEKDQLTN